MLTGIIYFVVIILANTVGAISGMGGGVIIKPVLDSLGFHSVNAISFFSTVAVFVMSIVSTYRQVQNGIQLKVKPLCWIAIGSVSGGYIGNIVFQYLLNRFTQQRDVLLIQIALTLVVLLFALVYSYFKQVKFELSHVGSYFACGLILGFFASLLGIGGGPINVSLFMLMFSFPIKEATVYSIATIFFSQFAKIATIAMTTGFALFDLRMLYFVIPAAILGGFFGAKLSGIFSPECVAMIFRMVIVMVILINVYNGYIAIMK